MSTVSQVDVIVHNGIFGTYVCYAKKKYVPINDRVYFPTLEIKYCLPDDGGITYRLCMN